MRAAQPRALWRPAAEAGGRSQVIQQNPVGRRLTTGTRSRLGSSLRLLFAAWTPVSSAFSVLKVLGNNCLTRIFQIIVMYLQVLECERNQHLVQTSW